MERLGLNPNSLRSRADLERTLSDYNLSIDGTVPTLRERLCQHLMQLEAWVTKNMLQTNVPLSKPTAVCVASDDLLLCADDGHRVVYQIQLEQNGVTINGKLPHLQSTGIELSLKCCYSGCFKGTCLAIFLLRKCV